MRYDEVRKMEGKPFDEDVLDKVCSPYYWPSMISDVYAVLIVHYFRKYDEQYGTHLTKGVMIPQVIPGHDAECEENSFWLEEIPEIMDKAMCLGGWNVAWIGTDEVGMQEALEGQSDTEVKKRDFHSAYRKYLDELFEDGYAKSCFMEEEEMAMDAAEYLEDGQIGIMWNEKLERYMRCRTEKRDMVAAVCPEEDRHIDMLSRNVWEPYMITYTQDMVEYAGEEYAGRKYCRIALGSDGFNYCWYDSVNPNWICSAIKLGRMLDLALEKIERYVRVKEEEAA